MADDRTGDARNEHHGASWGGTHGGATLRIAVLGATGFVGRHTVRDLLGRGHAVSAIVRDGAKAAQAFGTADDAPEDATPNRLTVVEGDLFDDATLERAGREGLDGVVNCIGIRRELPGVSFERAHVGAAERTVHLARIAGASRLVLISALGVGPNCDNDYARSKYAGETIVRRSGLDWTILRPSVVHGADGEMSKMLKGWALGRMAPFVFMPYFLRVEIDQSLPPKPPKFESARIAPVAVADVARAVSVSLERNAAAGEVYPLCGPEDMTWPEFLSLAKQHIPMASKHKPVLGLPGHLGWAMAIAAKPLGLSSAIPFGTSEPLLAIKDNIAETTKAHAHLGFEPAAFREGFAAYAGSI